MPDSGYRRIAASVDGESFRRHARGSFYSSRALSEMDAGEVRWLIKTE
jgi:hypothetical protein